MTFDSFSDEDVFHKEAAMSLGANPIKSFFHIELPLALPGILTGMLMAALAAFADFGTPAVIGGEFPLLPTAVYNEFVSEVGGNMGMASTVGIVMIFLSTIMLYAQRTILAKKTYAAVSVKRYTLAKPKKGTSAIIGVYVAVVLIMSFLPHVTLCVVSFMEWKYGVLMGNFTLSNYQKLFEQQLTPIWDDLCPGPCRHLPYAGVWYWHRLHNRPQALQGHLWLYQLHYHGALCDSWHSAGCRLHHDL